MDRCGRGSVRGWVGVCGALVGALVVSGGAGEARALERVDEGMAAEARVGPAAPKEDARAKTRVKLENLGDLDVRLYEITESAMAVSGSHIATAVAWRPVCAAPCERVLDLSDGKKFFVGGDEVTGSRPFDLVSWSEKPEVTISVEPGSKRKTVAGYWMIMGGTIAAAMGTGAAGAGALAASLGGGSEFGIGHAFMLAGAVLVPAGVGLIVPGVRAVKKGRTGVSFH